MQLKSELGLGSYKTAWLLAMKLRRAMVAPGRTPLAGLVEVDETEIPFRTRDDPPEGGHGRSHQGKLLVVGAVEIESRAKEKLRLGRIRLAPIADFSATTLHVFIRANIVPDSTAKTIEPEGELVEVGLQVLGPQAVIDAETPGLQVGEDAMDGGHDDVGGHRSDRVGLVGHAWRAR